MGTVYNTEKSETYPFYSEEADEMSKREQLKEYFSQSLEVELLLRLCPDDEDSKLEKSPISPRIMAAE